jgi:GNAT superfamily N-acetyltransferase
MGRRIIDVTLDNLGRVPPPCLESVFWELADDPPVDPRFEKEEWFSSTLLEWGPCAKLVVDGDRSVAYVQYAPASLFPRLKRFRCGEVSSDAVYLACCYVVEAERGRGQGRQLVREVGREVADRGYRAVEALGDWRWDGGWVLPAPFLGASGFTVIREDRRHPLMRLDLRTAVEPKRREAAMAAPAPMPAPGVA